MDFGFRRNDIAADSLRAPPAVMPANAGIQGFTAAQLPRLGLGFREHKQRGFRLSPERGRCRFAARPTCRHARERGHPGLHRDAATASLDLAFARTSKSNMGSGFRRN